MLKLWVIEMVRLLLKLITNNKSLSNSDYLNSSSQKICLSLIGWLNRTVNVNQQLKWLLFERGTHKTEKAKEQACSDGSCNVIQHTIMFT